MGNSTEQDVINESLIISEVQEYIRLAHCSLENIENMLDELIAWQKKKTLTL
jgi:hypothetical protein